MNSGSTPSSTGAPCPQEPELAEQSAVFGDRSYRMRPLGTGDEGRLIDFFLTHSEETIRQRYGFRLAHMSESRARKMVDVDLSRDVALTIIEPMEGDDVIRAVGRYHLNGDCASAEVAFVVSEQVRNLGLCSHLLRALLRIAGRRGLSTLMAQVHGDNFAMLRVFQKAGAKLRPILGTGSVEVIIPVSPLR